MAGSIVLLSLLSVCLADAAPRRGTSGPICDPQTPVARKLPRHPKSFGGPLKRPSSHALAGLQDISARIRRGTHTVLGENVAVIQNDTSAAVADAGDHLIPSLLRSKSSVPWTYSLAAAPSPRGRLAALRFRPDAVFPLVVSGLPS